MKLTIKHLGLRDYVEVWEAMREFTEARGPKTGDEVWLVEHFPVFTLGRNGDPAHILVRQDRKIPAHGSLNEGRPVFPSLGGERRPKSLEEGEACSAAESEPIVIVESDRGGQVTYHGPGQLIAYVLFDLNRLGIGVRSLVTGLENAVIETLSQYGIRAEARRDAPGVYVDGKKIASLGLRIRKGCSYHGLSLNADMDLSPFKSINPCGYPGLAVTSLADAGVSVRLLELAVPLVGGIIREFGYTRVEGLRH